jgi:hypothetical protein
MLKNSLFLVACIFITAAAWFVFHIFGQHTFAIMLLITAAMVLKTVWVKFNHKK